MIDISRGTMNSNIKEKTVKMTNPNHMNKMMSKKKNDFIVKDM